MIIDAHNHPEWYGHGISKFIENMDANRIDATWLLSWECPADEWDPTFTAAMPVLGEKGPIPFSRCVAFAEQAPDRFVLGYAPDPRRPDAIDRLKAAVDIHGVRVCGELKLRMMYDNPDALRLFRYCGGAGLPVILHLDDELSTGSDYPRPNWWYGGGIEALARVLSACPETTFIGHAPGFWSHISANGQGVKEIYPRGPIVPGGRLVELLQSRPNLCCDMSAESGWNALNRDHDFTRSFLDEFQDRVLYGRDWFDTRHRELLDSLDLPAGILGKVNGGNALRLIPLKR